MIWPLGCGVSLPPSRGAGEACASPRTLLAAVPEASRIFENYRSDTNSTGCDHVKSSGLSRGATPYDRLRARLRVVPSETSFWHPPRTKVGTADPEHAALLHRE
jgi:hypothetical protein